MRITIEVPDPAPGSTASTTSVAAEAALAGGGAPSTLDLGGGVVLAAQADGLSAGAAEVGRDGAAMNGALDGGAAPSLR